MANREIARKRPGNIHLLCASGIAMLFGALAFSHLAKAASADLVLCDRVAADPGDPDKPASIKGVGQIDPNDVAIAIQYCKSAAGSARRALYQLGRGYAAQGQMPAAISAYRKAADKGSSSAMVELGVLYATGNGVAKDEAQARLLFEKAANAGNPRGLKNLAAIGGGGATADPVRMRAILAKSAEANSSEAQYQLGMMMAEGIGGPRDDAAARVLFEKAAAQDHPAALERLGIFLESGRGGPADTAGAKSYLERASALGNEAAKAELEHFNCKWVLKDKRGNVVGCL
jgi:TPR repeat protein